MSGIRFPEFLQSLESTRYPFNATASLSNGRVTLLEGTLLDAHLYAVTGTNRYYISRVEVTSGGFTLVIGDSGGADRLFGVVTFPITEAVVRLTDVYGRSGGLLVSEPARLALISAWGVGTHTFERTQTEFCVTCQMPIPDPGVTGFRLENGQVVSGKVWWLGDDGVILSTEDTQDAQGNSVPQIRADVVGDPLYLQRLCEPTTLFEPINPIRLIRVKNQGELLFECAPSEQGNIHLQMNDSLAADAALRIRTTPEGIIIEVAGSTPEA